MARGIINLAEILDKTNHNVSLEMIDPQFDDKVIDEIRNCFGDLCSLVDSENISTTYELFKNKAAFAVIKKLDTTISNRFKIKFKHIATDNCNYGVLTVPPINYNVLNKDTEDSYKKLKEYSTELEPYFKKKDPDEVNDDKDFYNIINNWRNSFKSLDDVLKTSTVIVDNKRAEIKGLPSDYHISILGDLVFLIKTINLNPDELSAILLHEVGHAYTHIEYSYRTVNQTMVLIDTIRDTITKNNGSVKKALVLGYEKAFGHKMVIKSDTEVEAIISIANNYLDNTRYISKHYYSYTDSEQLADQFASRFGLQTSLSSAIAKLGTYNDNPYRKLSIISLALLPTAIIFAIASMSFLFGVGILVIGVIITYLFDLIGEVVDSLTTAGGSKRCLTYDDNKRRIIRIKNDIIRTIRLSELDKGTMSILLNNVEELNSLLEKIPDEKVSLIDRFFRRLTIVSEDAISSKLMEQLIEDVSENELYVASQKFKMM